MIKRIGLFAFYDKNGTADGLDLQYITAVDELLDYLIVIVNGSVSDNTMRNFEKIADNIVTRENVGFDAGAFRNLITNKSFYDECCKYDELILFNNTMFGPISPLTDIFEKMERSDNDFWGLKSNNSNEYITHIQSYFYVFKKNVFSSMPFKQFWENLNMDFTREEYLIAEYEIEFTRYLADHGFKWSVYNDKDFDVYRNPIELIKDGFPLVKKRIFRDYFNIDATEIQGTLKILSEKTPNIYLRLLDYIKSNNYNINKIRDYKDAGIGLSNKYIFSKVNNYDSIYVYGIKIRSFYILNNCKCSRKALIESDAYYKEDHQGQYHVYNYSEIDDHKADDSICLCVLEKKNLGKVKENIEKKFRNTLYLYGES